jgi:Fic family protein
LHERKKICPEIFGWLKRTDAHPLVASCVFHCELEFIHPFADGNGRIGRLWQTLILSRWNPLFAFLPVETVIRERQTDYFKVLAACDKSGNSNAFIVFLLAAILTALQKFPLTDQVAVLLRTLGHETLSGRRRHYPDLSSSNAGQRQNAERAAINMPI